MVEFLCFNNGEGPMRINKGHVEMLKEVVRASNREGSLGGASESEVCGLKKGASRSLRAMLGNGYVETFVTVEKTRAGASGMSTCHNPSGHTLYRLAAEGAAWLAEDAIEVEGREMEVRVAERLRGVPAAALREAGRKYSSPLLGRVADRLEGGAG